MSAGPAYHATLCLEECHRCTGSVCGRGATERVKGLHSSAWAGLLRQQRFTFSQLQRVELQDQGAGRAGSF